VSVQPSKWRKHKQEKKHSKTFSFEMNFSGDSFIKQAAAET
jgi:hypothetical protein